MVAGLVSKLPPLLPFGMYLSMATITNETPQQILLVQSLYPPRWPLRLQPQPQARPVPPFHIGGTPLQPDVRQYALAPGQIFRRGCTSQRFLRLHAWWRVLKDAQHGGGSNLPAIWAQRAKTDSHVICGASYRHLRHVWLNVIRVPGTQ